MDEHKWPYLWGKGLADEFAVHKDKLYLFPEHEQPQELVESNEKLEYSTNPGELGNNEVMLTGEQFIAELEARDIVEEVGGWSD